jgi:hypothetical protein
MLKPVIAAAALFALAGSTFVFAQNGFGPGSDQGFGGRGFGGDGGPRFERWHHLSATDMAAFTDARVAALKAGLELTPDQAKNWPPFEQAVRDLAQMRIARVQAREAGNQPPPASPFDRLSQRADNMAKTSVALKKVADAGAPLYASLDDSQKGRFVMLAHFLRPHPRMPGFNQDGFGHHGWWQKDGSRFGQDNSGGGDNGDNAGQGSKL